MSEILLPENQFPLLDLWKPPLEIRVDEKGYQVLDLIRKKWLRLSPEEWVRQHVLFWLIHHTGYPAPLLSIERKVQARSGNRADVVCYGKNGMPLLLVECKAPGELISQITAMQAMKYNRHLQATFIWLTNGKQHRVLQFSDMRKPPLELPILPGFIEMELKSLQFPVDPNEKT